MTTEAAAASRPRAHELVLLHGQPGSAADWTQVTARLPAPLHAVAVDRPGYGSSPLAPCGLAANARVVLGDLDSRGIRRAVLVGHSYGGGVALMAASLAPDRVAAVVLLASIGPGCVNGWDRLLAAPGAGPLCAFVAWRLTPWLARARLARIGRRDGRPPAPGEHVNWQIWGHSRREHGPLWRSFLVEQRALTRELDALVAAVPSVRSPVLLLADPQDTMVPVGTARLLARELPDARLRLIEGAGHHLPRRAPDAVADAIARFLATVDDPAAASSPAVHPPGHVAGETGGGPRRAARSRTEGPQMAGDARLGTVVMFVQELDRSVSFYLDLLEFEVADRSPTAALLVSAGGTQLILRAMGQDAAHALGSIGYQYAIWTAASKDDLDRAEQVLRKRSVHRETRGHGTVTLVEGRDPDDIPVLICYPGPEQAGERKLAPRVYGW